MAAIHQGCVETSRETSLDLSTQNDVQMNQRMIHQTVLQHENEQRPGKTFHMLRFGRFHNIYIF